MTAPTARILLLCCLAATALGHLREVEASVEQGQEEKPGFLHGKLPLKHWRKKIPLPPVKGEVGAPQTEKHHPSKENADAVPKENLPPLDQDGSVAVWEQ